jgi:hypothetical protein
VGGTAATSDPLARNGHAISYGRAMRARNSEILRPDHGPVFFEDGRRPTYVNTIAVGKDGTVYAIARVPEGTRVRGDLIRIPPVQPER